MTVLKTRDQYYFKKKRFKVKNKQWTKWEKKGILCNSKNYSRNTFDDGVWKVHMMMILMDGKTQVRLRSHLLYQVSCMWPFFRDDSESKSSQKKPSERVLSQFYRREVRLGCASRKEIYIPLPAGSWGQWSGKQTGKGQACHSLNVQMGNFDFFKIKGNLIYHSWMLH